MPCPDTTVYHDTAHCTIRAPESIPNRNNRFRRFTLVFTYIYGVVGVWGLLQYPEVPEWVAPASFVYVAYYAAMSFFPNLGAAEPA